MTKKKWLLLVSVMLFAYFVVKHAVCYERHKFGEGAYFIVVPFVNFIPAFLFILSAYLLRLSLPENKRWLQLILSVAVTWLGAEMVYSFYDALEKPFITNYFSSLNVGVPFPKAEDFRVEYFLLFLFNIIVFVLFLRKWLLHSDRY